MTLDNSRKIVSIRLTLFVATFPFLAFLAVAYVARLVDFPVLGMSDTAWVVILSAIYFAIAYFPSFLKYNYIYFSDDGDSVIFRFYSTGIFKGAKQSIEIPKGTFAGFTTERKRLGLIQYIILFEERRGVIAKYPPVSLSALNHKEREKVFRSLGKYNRNE
ncbi:MAG: hypothetical protein R6W67_02875 [Bacteroidales bacterium]